MDPEKEEKLGFWDWVWVILGGALCFLWWLIVFVFVGFAWLMLTALLGLMEDMEDSGSDTYTMKDSGGKTIGRIFKD